jgi:hypothetical protein
MLRKTKQLLFVLFDFGVIEITMVTTRDTGTALNT